MVHLFLPRSVKSVLLVTLYNPLSVLLTPKHVFPKFLRSRIIIHLCMFCLRISYLLLPLGLPKDSDSLY